MDILYKVGFFLVDSLIIFEGGPCFHAKNFCGLRRNAEMKTYAMEATNLWKEKFVFLKMR